METLVLNDQTFLYLFRGQYCWDWDWNPMHGSDRLSVPKLVKNNFNDRTDIERFRHFDAVLQIKDQIHFIKVIINHNL